MTSISPALAALLGLALTLPLHAETLGEKTGVNSALDIAPTTKDFVTEAAISDMFEIQSSKLAEQRADEATKEFAAKMIEDHSKSTSELKPLATKAKTPVPTEMDSSHKSLLSKLQGLKGKDFTQQYHSDQVTAHKQAVSLFQRYGKGGDNDDLKTFASKTLPTIQDHLKMAQDLDK